VGITSICTIIIKLAGYKSESHKTVTRLQQQQAGRHYCADAALDHISSEWREVIIGRYIA